MGYLHFDIEYSQIPKSKNGICGDVIYWERSRKETIFIVSDGKGHGVRANIAATMCVSRLKELIHKGFSVNKAFVSVANTMSKDPATNRTYAVFSICYIQSDGLAKILNYGSPRPILVSRNKAIALRSKSIDSGGLSLGEEYSCILSPKDSLILVSDGVSLAGVGRGLVQGWTIENLATFIDESIASKISIKALPKLIAQKAATICADNKDDDISAAVIICKGGETVNIFTGPPQNKALDNTIARKFMNESGVKIVCGATSAKIMAAALGKRMEIDNLQKFDDITPPSPQIEGIDLVTEGEITLNHLYNIMDEDRENMIENNPATELYDYLSRADKINFLVGRAKKAESTDIEFKQLGLIEREVIVPLIADNLRRKGKLALIEYI
jgi:precorrin-3B methylase